MSWWPRGRFRKHLIVTVAPVCACGCVFSGIYTSDFSLSSVGVSCCFVSCLLLSFVQKAFCLSPASESSLCQGPHTTHNKTYFGQKYMNISTNSTTEANPKWDKAVQCAFIGCTLFYRIPKGHLLCYYLFIYLSFFSDVLLQHFIATWNMWWWMWECFALVQYFRWDTSMWQLELRCP